MLQYLVAFGIVRQRFKFRDQIQNVLRAVADVFAHVFRAGIEHEILRQITDGQIARRVTSPLSGDCRPARMRRKVVLPQPLRPTRPMRSPS
jgi:hypothetical protein